MNQKGLAPILIILLLASLVIFGFLVWKGSSRSEYQTKKPPSLPVTTPQPVASMVPFTKYVSPTPISSPTGNFKNLKRIGEFSVDIPSSWNVYMDIFTIRNSSMHLITSYQFDSFEFPKKGEYAFLVGSEDRNISLDLESYLKSKQSISKNQKLNKADNGTIFIRRDVGNEYFNKNGDTILVIFVYDNGDQIIDSTEQRIIDSFSI